ncbi:efflux RND transporter periplasmic adaptor subunit [Candidatus Pelagibacter sp.]|nr:efflux RND transporter periplasmic adaptor subunit [Candidatus Pelagibacter sp.]
MKRSTKIISIVLIFFFIIAAVIIARTMIGNHFKKKFSKRPPPGIIVKVVEQKLFQNTIETFGTAVPAQIKSFNIEKYEILEPIKFNTKVKTGDVIAKLKNRNITTPFDGIIGKRDFSNDIDVSQSSIILNLEDTSVLFVDVDIPETFAPYVKKDQNVDIKFSGNTLKKYSGTVESTASRINTNKRSLPVRIKLDNPNSELLSGSLLEISINYNERNSLSILDTSLIMEGDNVYVYKVDKENTIKKVPVEIGLRKKGIVEIKSGLEEGDTVVAEGLKKTRPNGKIKPIKHGTKEKVSSWKKKDKPAKTETKKSKFDWLKKLNPFKKSETEKK